MQSPHYIALPKAMTILQPYVPDFARCLKRSVHEWNTGLGHLHVQLDEFARSVIINRLWYTSAEQILPPSMVKADKVGNGKYLVIDETVVVRFKHLDKSYRPQNYPTERSTAWDKQLSFPSIPALARLDLGYRMDLTGTIVQTAMIMLNIGKHTVWRHQIWGYPVSEFASTPKDLRGNLVYSHSDHSGVTI